MQNIVEALHDYALTYQTSKPIYRPAEPETKPKRDRTPPSKENTYSNALEGKPITNADEDAIARPVPSQRSVRITIFLSVLIDLGPGTRRPLAY